MPTQLNADGFGVGWYSPEIQHLDPCPCVFTSTYVPPSLSPSLPTLLYAILTLTLSLLTLTLTLPDPFHRLPAWNNKNLWRLARKVRAPLMFAHVRAASPGSSVTDANCHPFSFGKYMFMHNGGISDFKRLKRRLVMSLRDEVYEMIDGSTDSEHAFGVFLNQLPKEEFRAASRQHKHQHALAVGTPCVAPQSTTPTHAVQMRTTSSASTTDPGVSSNVMCTCPLPGVPVTGISTVVNATCPLHSRFTDLYSSGGDINTAGLNGTSTSSVSYSRPSTPSISQIDGMYHEAKSKVSVLLPDDYHTWFRPYTPVPVTPSSHPPGHNHMVRVAEENGLIVSDDVQELMAKSTAKVSFTAAPGSVMPQHGNELNSASTGAECGGSGMTRSELSQHDRFSVNESEIDGDVPSSHEILIRAVLHTIAQIVQVRNESNITTPFTNSLNFAVSDGESIVVTRYIPNENVTPATMYFSAGSEFKRCANNVYRMAQRDRLEDVIIIASERLTSAAEDWVEIPKNTMLVITKQLNVLIVPISLPTIATDCVTPGPAPDVLS
jgi:predicted glutamine amidotransferase